MIDHEPHDKTAAVWPPAITLPLPSLPDPRLCKTARLAKASLLASGAGVACLLGTVATLTLLANLHWDNFNKDPIVHAAYFAGLTCEVAGMTLGLFGKSTKTGKAGLFLSFGILCAMAVYTLAAHQAFSDSHGNSGWIWDANEGDRGNCGCDNLL